MCELKQKKYLKRVHIVQIQQKVKSKKRIDKVEQIDALSFFDEQAKIVSLVHRQNTWFLFFINRERFSKTQQKLRIFSLKLCFKPSAQDESVRVLSFDFISEVQAKLEDTYLKKDDKSKPSYLCAYFEPKVKRFYLYVGVCQSCAVYSKSLEDCGNLAPKTQRTPEKHQDVDDLIKRIEDEERREK